MADAARATLQSGWSQMDRAATEVVAATTGSATAGPQDIVDIRASGSPAEADPLLAGIRDMLFARQQVAAGAFLLHAYNQDRRTLYDLLKPDSQVDAP